MSSVSSIPWIIVWSLSLRTSDGTEAWSVEQTDAVLEWMTVHKDDHPKRGARHSAGDACTRKQGSPPSVVHPDLDSLLYDYARRTSRYMVGQYLCMH